MIKLMNNKKVTNADVLDALKVFNKTGLAPEDMERTTALLHRKLTMEEVLRVVSIVVYPTNKYNMEAIKNISVANIMIDTLIGLIKKDSTDEEIKKFTDDLWDKAEKEYLEANKKKEQEIQEKIKKAQETTGKEDK